MNWYSSVSTVIGIWVQFPTGGQGFFSPLLLLDLLWDPPSLLFNGYHEAFPRV